jgi:hypothetical protein
MSQPSSARSGHHARAAELLPLQWQNTQGGKGTR